MAQKGLESEIRAEEIQYSSKVKVSTIWVSKFHEFHMESGIFYIVGTNYLSKPQSEHCRNQLEKERVVQVSPDFYYISVVCDSIKQVLYFTTTSRSSVMVWDLISQSATSLCGESENNESVQYYCGLAFDSKNRILYNLIGVQ